MTPFEEAVEIIKELLKGGQHEGPCWSDGEDTYGSCDQHVVASAARDSRAREFLSMLEAKNANSQNH